MPHQPFYAIVVVYDFSGDREAAPTEWEETLPRCRTLQYDCKFNQFSLQIYSIHNHQPNNTAKKN